MEPSFLCTRTTGNAPEELEGSVVSFSSIFCTSLSAVDFRWPSDSLFDLGLRLSLNGLSVMFDNFSPL